MAKKIKKKYKVPADVKRTANKVVGKDEFVANENLADTVKSVSDKAKKTKKVAKSQPDKPIRARSGLSGQPKYTEGLDGEMKQNPSKARLSSLTGRGSVKKESKENIKKTVKETTIESGKAKLRKIRDAYKKNPTQANRNALQKALKNFGK